MAWELPTGTISFLFTDIEGSARLWEEHPEAMRRAMARHDALAEAAVGAWSGRLVRSRGEGDSLFAVFSRPSDAVNAARALQQAYVSEPWPLPGALPLRVRMALHIGEAELREGDYYGSVVNRCARIRATGHGGQVLLSGAMEASVRNAAELPEGARLRDLGLHRLKDLQQPERIFQLMHPALPADFPPLRSLQAFANNLPQQIASFIGREQEIQEIRQRLQTARLLTLTGTGGVGKTRLSLQVGADLLEDWPDGVWLAELASLSDPALVVPATASALGLREVPGCPLIQTLADYLLPMRLLLLLDNCEHLLSAWAHLADTLLRASPGLRILATSREALGVAGEQIFHVPSLSLPDPQRLPSQERLIEFEAIRLFAERATAVFPPFTITSANAGALAQICHRLDGIPLAIELAAARTRALPPAVIAARLDDRFRLLTGGSRPALPRQQTLRALIDWSYDLLNEQEKILLRRLSVFAGGWTLEAAEEVCSSSGLKTPDILDLMTSLVDKSLVIFEQAAAASTPARYRQLETIRQYSRERLRESGESDAVRRRHRDAFLRLAEEADSKLNGPEQAAWLERLETEHDNLRAALDWCLQEPEGAETGLRFTWLLWRFWKLRGHFEEGRQWYTAALGREGASEPTTARAYALNGAGVMARMQGDYSAARQFFSESLSLHRVLGNQPGTADALGNLGLVAIEQGDYEVSQALYEESLAISRELGDEAKEGTAATLSNLGNLTFEQGDYNHARAYYEESLVLRREMGDKKGIALALGNMGNMADTQGDFAAAHRLYEESLTLSQELGDRWGITFALGNKGLMALKQGDLSSSHSLLQECLTLCRELGERRISAYMLEALGRWELAAGTQSGQAERAARLFGAAQALREAIGAPLPPNERETHEKAVSAARATLGETVFSAAWAEGQALSWEQAIDYALQKQEG